MGKPATAYWCENGHLTDKTGSGEWSSIDMVLFDEEGDAETLNQLSCNICGSFSATYMYLNWQDPEYCSKCYDEKNPVCHCGPTLKTRERIERKDIEGNIYCEYVPIYNCSMLQKRIGPKNWAKK